MRRDELRGVRRYKEGNHRGKERREGALWAPA